MKNKKLGLIIKMIVFFVALVLLVLGHRSHSIWGLITMLIGLSLLLIELYLYNEKMTD